jgi:protein polybromo-1
VCFSGEAFISGAYYVTPSQVEHTPTRLFYKREVLKTSREGSVSMSNVLGRCAVLSLKEYTTCRFTEIDENDVFVCDSKFSDVDKTIKKFNKPLKVSRVFLLKS